MSCQTCAGCFTGNGCHDTKPSKSQKTGEAHYFYSLLEQAAAASSSRLDSDLTHHDHTIPTIVSLLSNNVYGSQVALFEALNHLEHADFLELSRRCYDHGVTGMLIAWAWQYCHGDANSLLESLRSASLPSDASPRKQSLWDYLDEQAEVYELFNGLAQGAAGRVHRTEKVTT